LVSPAPDPLPIARPSASPAKKKTAAAAILTIQTSQRR
jgi:hypothetical protein